MPQRNSEEEDPASAPPATWGETWRTSTCSPACPAPEASLCAETRRGGGRKTFLPVETRSAACCWKVRPKIRRGGEGRGEEGRREGKRREERGGEGRRGEERGRKE
eukprot:746729-Hanusia_phi.AAC.1